MKKFKNLFPVIIICFCLLSACKTGTNEKENDGGKTLVSTVAPSFTPTAVPTAVPSPTPTPSPSPTPLPSPTPTPTPTPTIEDIMTETDDHEFYTLSDLDLEGYYFNVIPFGDHLIYFFNETGFSNPKIISYDISSGEKKEKDIDFIDTMDYGFDVIKDKYIVLNDKMKEYYFYDEELREINRFTVPLEIDSPEVAVNSDYSKVYYFSGKELYSCDTFGGEPELILKDKRFYDGYPSALTEDGKFLIANLLLYDMRGYQTFYCNLETGEVIDCDHFSYNMNYYVSPDKKKMIAESSEFLFSEVYSLDSDFTGILDLKQADEGLRDKPEAVKLSYSENEERLLKDIDWDRGYAITIHIDFKDENNILNLLAYDINTGEIHSNCVLSIETPIGNNYALALDTEKGYLFISGSELKDTFCYVWNYVSDKVESLGFKYPRRGYIPEYLDSKRKELEEKYPMNFYLGTEIFATDTDYFLKYCEYPSKMYEALCLFDEIFSLYPENLFEQIKYKNIKTLGIYSCAGFVKDASYGIDNAAALAGNDDYEKFLCMDVTGFGDLRKNIIHELSHWIDDRVIKYGRETGEFDFEALWDDLNPNDYYYMNDYNKESPFIRYTYEDNMYFIDSYSLTKATEDRARIFENLMRYNYKWNVEYFKSGHLRDKARLYFEYIRKAFDTTGWPEETIWEKKLRLLDEYYSGESNITLEEIYPEMEEAERDYSIIGDDYGSNFSYYKDYAPVFG